MAKISPYKFVNPGVIGNSSVPVVRATSKNLLATNRIGLTVEGIANSLAEITNNNKALVTFFENQAIQQKKAMRLEMDREAEAKQEKAKSRLKSVQEEKAKEKEEGINTEDTKKEGEGFLGWAESFFAPFVNIFKDIAAIMIAKGITEFLSDEEKKQEIQDFFRKAFEVGEVVYKFFDGQVKGFLDGWKKLSNPENDFITRLGGLGDMFKGIILLRYLMNPFALIEDIFTIIDGIGTFFDRKAKGKLDPDGKLKKTDAQLKKMGLTDDQIKAYRKAREGGATATQALQQARKVTPKRNIFQRGADAVGGFISDAQKKLMAKAKSTWGLVSEASQKLYAQLSEAARKQWENMVTMGKKLAAKSSQVASSVGNKFGDAAKWVKDGTLKLADDAKNAVQQKLLQPVFEFLQPLTDRLKLVAGKIQDALFGSPLGKQAAEALKKKGLFPPLDNLGPLAKKLGGKAIPILGGLVNLLFAYDRFQGGDPFGGLLEAVSAGFDLAGLIPGGQFGPPISMGIDAYMLARDFIPGIQQGEEAVINSIPGAKAIGDQMKALGQKLPPLSGLLNAIGIGGNQQEGAAAGGNLSGKTLGYQRAVAAGKMLNAQGIDVWQHPDFNVDRGYTGSGRERVMRRSYNSFHNYGEALDVPVRQPNASGQVVWDDAKLTRLHGQLNAKRQELGIAELKWQDDANHFDHLHVAFKGGGTLSSAQIGAVGDTTGGPTGGPLGSNVNIEPAKPFNIREGLQSMIEDLTKTFGGSPSAETSAIPFDPNVDMNVADKSVLTNALDFSKIFAMDQANLQDVVPVAFSVAEPIYLPMPINNGDKVINAFTSPLLSGK